MPLSAFAPGGTGTHEHLRGAEISDGKTWNATARKISVTSLDLGLTFGSPADRLGARQRGGNMTATAGRTTDQKFRDWLV